MINQSDLFYSDEVHHYVDVIGYKVPIFSNYGNPTAFFAMLRPDNTINFSPIPYENFSNYSFYFMNGYLCSLLKGKQQFSFSNYGSLYGDNLIGKFVVKEYDLPQIYFIADTFEECFLFLNDRFFSGLRTSNMELLYIDSIERNLINSSGQYYTLVNCSFQFYGQFNVIVMPYCCLPDFAPIVEILGGVPSLDQLINLKSICHLLGVDTSSSGLLFCDLMKDYLKRLVQILGGTPLNEPNDNLKSICQLLGVNTAENGLKDCELSKEYVKRIGVTLGVQYA